MSIGEFCTREVVITERDTGIVELAQLMRTHHVGDVVVVEKQGDLVVPVGIVTDRDIVMELIAAQVDLDSVTTGDVMSPELATAGEKEGIWDTLQRMRSKGVRRLPVVNEDGGLEGILTVDDLIDLLAEELALLAKIADRGQALEEVKRE
jgi:signal-transduction protein with cAMP-binding, CBS, and nucleotidyltransferase domain